MSRPLRWALIGASDIAATRLIPAIRANGQSITSVRSGTLDHAQSYAQTHGIDIATTSLLEAVDRDDVDAVYISSVNTLHREQCEVAAKAGKHVLAEKPLAMTVLDAQAMVDACASAGVVMATNHHLPASPTHRVIKDLVSSGSIGDVRAIRFHHAVQLPDRLAGWRINAVEEGGVIFDVTVHDAAAIAAILGTHAKSVRAVGMNQDNDPAGPPDAVVTSIEWEGNVLVQTHDAYNNAHLPTGIHILGTRGAIVAENCNTGDPVGDVWLVKNHQRQEISIPDREDLYIRTVRQFQAAVHGQGSVIVSGQDGVHSLAVAAAAYESVRTGKTISI